MPEAGSSSTEGVGAGAGQEFGLAQPLVVRGDDGGQTSTSTVRIEPRSLEFWDGAWRRFTKGLQLGIGWSSFEIEHAVEL